MNSLSVVQLNKTFSFKNKTSRLEFKQGAGNIPLIEIENEFATARISLQGAHLLSWIPQSYDDVIWLSKEASFQPAKSIRGGIPICWPWFGAHKIKPDYPAHGFARTVMWKVLKTEVLSKGETLIVFGLDTHELPDSLQKMWPDETRAEYSITVSNALTLELVTHNESDRAIVIGQALHTYFNVQDITKVRITGLENKTYLDKPDDFKAKVQDGVISVDGEVDRVYLDTADDVIIDNKTRRIKIQKTGSHSTVVWNPGEMVADKMGDMGENGFLEMLCVESANAADDVVTIEQGRSHCLKVIYELESL